MPYTAPINPEEAFRFLESNNPKIVAGCTDYFPGLQQGQIDEDLLDVTRINGMRGITHTETGWRIGGATTWTDVVRASLPPAFDALKLAAHEVGSLQIQNQGTVAGNICNASPAADGVPPLLALNAQVEVGSMTGRRIVALSDFIMGVRQIDLNPDEMVIAIHIPDISRAANSGFAKLGSRKHLVISIAMVGAVVEEHALREQVDDLLPVPQVVVGFIDQPVVVDFFAMQGGAEEFGEFALRELLGDRLEIGRADAEDVEHDTVPAGEDLGG